MYVQNLIWSLCKAEICKQSLLHRVGAAGKVARHTYLRACSAKTHTGESGGRCETLTSEFPRCDAAGARPSCNDSSVAHS